MTRMWLEYEVSMLPIVNPLVIRRTEMLNRNVWLALTPVASVTVSVMLKRPGDTGVPHTSTCVGLTNQLVLTLPDRMSMPGGNPWALHVNGARPPLWTPKLRVHGTP